MSEESRKMRMIGADAPDLYQEKMYYTKDGKEIRLYRHDLDTIEKLNDLSVSLRISCMRLNTEDLRSYLTQYYQKLLTSVKTALALKYKDKATGEEADLNYIQITGSNLASIKKEVNHKKCKLSEKVLEQVISFLDDPDCEIAPV